MPSRCVERSMRPAFCISRNNNRYCNNSATNQRRQRGPLQQTCNKETVWTLLSLR